MAELEDPREALSNKDVTLRAAAVRSLAIVGTFEDVAPLVRLAMTDKSPSVRLYSAAAAADIAMRYVGEGAGVSLDQRRGLVDLVKGFDPGINPSLLMVLAAVPEKAVVDRLGRMLRDPRYDVRAGAATAIRRMALSSATATAPWFRDSVATWLADGKHPQDAVLELIRLVGEVGWTGLDAQLGRAEAAGRPHGAAVEEALGRVRARRDVATWSGLWVSWGVDVFQPEPEAPRDWWFVADGHAAGPDGADVAVVLDDGAARFGDQPARLIFAPRPAEEGLHAALQLGNRLFWRQEGKALLKLAGDLADSLGTSPRASLGVASSLEAIEGVVAPRVRARLLWRSGALAQAEVLLEGQVDDKKPRAEVLWMLAEVKLGLGDLDSARELVEQALESAPKKAAWRDEAEALRSSLVR